jgi:hypothetical protein
MIRKLRSKTKIFFEVLNNIKKNSNININNKLLLKVLLIIIQKSGSMRKKV